MKAFSTSGEFSLFALWQVIAESECNPDVITYLCPLSAA